MAEQRSPTTGSRPAARRRAPARRRRSPVRWIAPVLAVAAGAVVLVPLLTPALLEVTAATTAVAPAAPARVDVPALPAPAPVLARAQGVDTRGDVAAGGGLAVPQPPRPGQITIMPNAAVGRAPTYHQRPDACGGAGTNPRRMVPGVVPGAGRATLDWLSDNRPEVLGYRVQAVSQRLVSGAQPPPVVVSAAQPAGCVPVSVTVSGLTPGEPYVFWLEEQVTSASTGVTRLVQVGTTEAVVIG